MDTTECGRETKQNERQQQGGSWGHSPEIVSKNGARRVRQRQDVMIAAIVHIINTGQLQSEIHNEDWAQAERKIELSGAARHDGGLVDFAARYNNNELRARLTLASSRFWGIWAICFNRVNVLKLSL